MKKITAALLLLTVLLAALALSSCGGEDKDILGLIVAYKGGPVTTTDHVFTPDEFYVIATYPNNVDKTLESTDFTVENAGMQQGYYIIKVIYRGFEEETYVKCEIPIYPSDFEG